MHGSVEYCIVFLKVAVKLAANDVVYCEKNRRGFYVMLYFLAEETSVT